MKQAGPELIAGRERVFSYGGVISQTPIEGWWRRRESNTKSAICRQLFNSLTVRELWSQLVDTLPTESISLVCSRLLRSSQIHPVRGDILEAAGTWADRVCVA